MANQLSDGIQPFQHIYDGRMLADKALEPSSLTEREQIFLEAIRMGRLGEAFLAFHSIDITASCRQPRTAVPENSQFTLLAYANALNSESKKIALAFLEQLGFKLEQDNAVKLINYFLLLALNGANPEEAIDVIIDHRFAIPENSFYGWILRDRFPALYSKNLAVIEEDAITSILNSNTPTVKESG